MENLSIMCANDRIKNYIKLYLKGDISEQDYDVLKNWLEENSEHVELFENIKNGERLSQEIPLLKNIQVEEGWKRFKKQTRKTRHLHHYFKYIAIIFILFMSYYLFQVYSDSKNKTSNYLVIHPESSNAILILENNDTIFLNSKETKEILVADYIGINLKEGESEKISDSVNVIPRHQTIEIPRGGEYIVIFSDGSKVYLNSGSRITYPLRFNSEERVIQFFGEAYFEVSKDTNSPFKIKSENIELCVYGTEFNLNTYSPKNVETVLVEGSIGIKGINQDKEYILKPGQLGHFNSETEIMNISEVNVNNYTAWKQGLFIFDEISLERLMEKLSHWYDVEIIFNDRSLANLHFTGHLKRYDDMNLILEVLTDATDIKFITDEKRIWVLNK